MFKGIVIVFLLALGGLFGFAATKPDTFLIERSLAIKASPDKIFAYISDFHEDHWGKWSPWEGLDPQLKRTYSGATSGKGAVYEWAGDRKVGSGRMEIVDATPPYKLTMKLEFFKPFKAQNTVEFTLVPEGDMTKVTWSMHGQNSYMTKVMQVFCSMEKMVGKDYEKGLDSLKTLTE